MYEDADGDMGEEHRVLNESGTDCDDGNDSIYPNATEIMTES